MTNELQEKLIFLQDVLINPCLITNWVNGNLYQRSSEVFGVLPIPADIMLKSGMSGYNASVDYKQHHHFLAAAQGTRKPVLPVHTPDEKKLFTQLMRSDQAFNSTTALPNWNEAVKVWNRYAEVNAHVSYKVCPHKVNYGAEDTDTCFILADRAAQGLLWRMEKKPEYPSIFVHVS